MGTKSSKERLLKSDMDNLSYRKLEKQLKRNETRIIGKYTWLTKSFGLIEDQKSFEKYEHKYRHHHKEFYALTEKNFQVLYTMPES